MTRFLNIISEVDFPPIVLLVNLDVSLLYTNIPHADGIQSSAAAYKRKKDELVDSGTRTKLLELILNFNHLKFEDDHYLRTIGTAMGTKMAPNYANVFIGDLEDNFLRQ